MCLNFKSNYVVYQVKACLIVVVSFLVAHKHSLLEYDMILVSPPPNTLRF